jgi:hypothetical protein
MRAFTLSRGGYVKPGIPAGDLHLGEPGRGRHLTIVPMVNVPEGVTALDHVRVGKTEGGVVLAPCDGSCGDTRALVLVKGEPTYRRGARYPAYQELWDGTLPQGVETLASGWGAWGDAGRLGEWEEALLLLQPGALFRIRNRYESWAVEWDGQELRLYTRAAWEARLTRSQQIEWL